MLESIEQAGYRAGTDITIGLDVASTEFWREGQYHLEAEGRKISLNDLIMLLLFQSLSNLAIMLWLRVKLIEIWNLEIGLLEQLLEKTCRVHLHRNCDRFTAVVLNIG